MNTKNLALKFLFLTLVAVVCLWSLSPYGPGLKQGIDLKGGHSLTFEILSDTDRIDELKSQKDDISAQIEKTDDAVLKTNLEERLAQLTSDIATLTESVSAKDRTTETIRVLKERIDPMGLLSLEWRPVGFNRFEVRMPAGNEVTSQAKAVYRKSIDDLSTGNIQRSQLRRLERIDDPEKLSAQIQVLSQGDAELAGLLENLVSAYRTKEATGTQADISAWEEAQTAVLESNVKVGVLQGILKNYVQKRELDAAETQQAKDALIAKQVIFEDTLAKFRQENFRNPTRLAQIDRAVDAYKTWSDKRTGLDDPADLIRMITKAGVLEFRIAPYLGGEGQDSISSAEATRYIQILTETIDSEGPQGLQRRSDAYLWFPIKGKKSGYNGLVAFEYAGQKYILLCNTMGKTLLNRPGKTKWELADAREGVDSRGAPAVDFQMNQIGASLMGELTGDHIKSHMAILLDNECYSAPVIQSRISGRGQITMGEINRTEVMELVKTLRAGSLPARINPEPVAQSSFGPTFGETNRELGKQAAIWALVAVAVFMLVYYLMAGAIADIALVLNIILILGAMSLLKAVFTLPGIAGVILTIGIAVDANVLIFERLREEQAKAQSIRMALKNAYERAFSAIFDANITTLITCLILAWVGTEEVRGFGITLGFGVAFSMFTALVLTRWIFQILLNLGVVKNSIPMLRLMGVAKINWMGKRYVFWFISIAMLVMGIMSLAWQGKDILGIEFSSGTQAVITLRDDALVDGELPSADNVRDNFLAGVEAKRKEEPAKYANLYDTAKVEERIDYTRVEKFLNNFDTGDASGVGKADGKISAAEWELHKKDIEFFAKLDSNSDGVLDSGELEKLPERSYQVTTTETDVAMIRKICDEVFGESLQRRTSCDYTLVKSSDMANLGLRINDKGYGFVSPNPNSPLADTQEDYADGVVYVFEDVSPAITVAEFQDRINDMKAQPDFAGKTLFDFKVEGLTPVEDGFTSFAVFVRSSESVQVTSTMLDRLGENTLEPVEAALSTSEAMVASNFDAAIAGKAAQTAIVAIIMSWFAIVAYLWLRFGSIRWGLAAVVCLIHDVLILVGLIAASGWIANTEFGRSLGIASFKIDLAMVAAILTVIGYSVNDTIVVFDRIRENRGRIRDISVTTINDSINQTLSRTLLTSMTTLLVVVIMYVMGGAAIRPFSFALLVGVLFGTYSSIAIASPLLMGVRKALATRAVYGTSQEGAAESTEK